MRTPEEVVEDLKTNVGVAADLVARHIKPELVNVAPDDVANLGPDGSNAVSVLVLPTGLKAHSIKPFLDAYRTAPERRAGTASLVELASFIDHVNRFKDEDSALFAKPSEGTDTPTLTAVFDYHRKNSLQVVREEEQLRMQFVEGGARFGRHRAAYAFPLSDEWLAWVHRNAKSMSQGDFADFIEDRVIDVADPQAAFSSAKKFAEALGIPSFASGTKLLQLARGLTIHVDERVTSKIDPSTGETTLLFSQAHNDEQGAPLEVPRAFLLQIPVFRAGAAYQFAVRLKYRTGGGKVAWSFEIHDVAKAIADAFREACEHAREKTSLPLFYGSPET